MRIDKLKLTNFRCHADLEIAVDPAARTVVVAGFNDKGKSTINDALAFLYAGRCRGVGGGGQGMGDLQRIGTSNSFGVEAETSVGTLRRGLMGPRSPIQAAITKQVGVSPERTLACLYGSEFLDLHPDKQQAMLQDILGVEMKLKDLEAHLSKQGNEMVGHYLNLCSITEGRLKLEDFALMEGFLRDDRRDAKRTLKGNLSEAPQPPEGINGNPSSAEAGEIMVALEKGIEGLQKEAGVLQTLVDKAGGSLEELEKRRDDLAERQLENHKMPVFTAEERDEALAVLDNPFRAACEAVAVAEKEEHDATAASVQAMDVAKADTDRIDSYQLAPDVGTMCGLCRRVHTKASVVATLKAHPHLMTVDEMTAEGNAIDKKGDLVAKAVERTHSAEQALEAARGLRVVASKNIEAAREQIAETYRASQDSEKDHNKIMYEMGTVQNRIKNAKDIAHEVLKLDTLEDRISAGRSKVKVLQSYISLREDYEVQVNAHTQAATSVAVMDELINSFKPSGLPAKLLSEVVEPFMEAVQEVMLRFGYSVKLSFSPFEMLVNGVSIRLAATSVRLRVGLAFQAAIAKWSGFKLVAMDNVDWLDKRGRESLMEVLGIVPEIDQVWLFQTLKGSALPEPALDGDTQLVVLPGE